MTRIEIECAKAVVESWTPKGTDKSGDPKALDEILWTRDKTKAAVLKASQKLNDEAQKESEEELGNS